MEKLHWKNIITKKLIITCKIISIVIVLLIILSCKKEQEIKLIIFNENQKEMLENIIIYKNYDIQVIKNGNYWTTNKLNEEMILDLVGIAHMKLDIISMNIANESTTQNNEENMPYVRKYIKITAENGIETVEDKENYPRFIYDPTHPDAIKIGDMQGFVRYPNVIIENEMNDMIMASRLYETATESLKKYNKYYIFM